jgi:hypothetical protein
LRPLLIVRESCRDAALRAKNIRGINAHAYRLSNHKA